MAEGPNVGYSTLSVIPTLRGLRQELESQLETPLQRSAAKAGAQASDELQDAFANTELIDNPDRLFAGVDSAAGRAGSAAADELAGASSEFRAAGADLAQAASSSFDLSPAANEAAGELSRALSSERGNVAAAGTDLGRAAGDGVEDGLRTADLSGVGRDVGAEAGGGIGGGIIDGLGDLSGGIGGPITDALEQLPAGLAGPAVAAGAAAGALLVTGVGQAIENGRIESSFEAALGVTERTAAEYGDIAGRVFSANWGDSLVQVSEAIRLVGQNFAGVGDLSQAELEQVSTAALQTAGIFDQDLRGSINAAAQLIRTGLVRDATEAFDLITVGLQGPANKADDLLDTFNEYSTQFRELGIDGPEALGLINQALQAGARDSDVAADALKEFAIRAQDGSDTTAAGFEAIGLNAELMGQRVAAGGDTARDALDRTLDGLRNIEDPALRSQTAVALFGTQAEDLGDALFALDLDTAAAQLGDIDGAAADAADSFDDLGSKIEELRRKAGTELGQVFEDFLAPFAVAADDESDLEDYGQAVGAAVERGLNLVPFSDIIGEWLDAAGIAGDDSVIGNINDWLFGGEVPEAPPSLRAVLDEVRIARQEAENAPPLLDLDAIVLAAPKAEDALADLNGEIELSGELFDIAEQRASDYLQAIGSSSDLDDAITAQLQLRDATKELVDGLGALQGVDIEAFAAGTIQVSDQAAAALGDVAGAGQAAQQQVANALQFEGDAAAIAKADELRAGFIEVFKAAGLSDDQVQDLLRSMGLLPEQIDTAITVSGVDRALAEISLLRDLIDRDFPPEVEAQIVLALNEGRADDARRLAGIYAEDIQDDLITDPLLLALGVENPERVKAQLQELYSDPSIPDELVVQAAVAVDEGRLADAENLLKVWEEDKQDGLIQNPLLIALGLGDTTPASGEIDGWKAGEEGKPPVEIPVGADTNPARAAIGGLMRDIGLLRPVVKVAAQITSGADRIADAAVIAAELRLGRDINGNGIVGRAAGGPINAGDLYMVGEREPELFVSDRAGRILNQQQIRDELPAMAGGGGVQLNLDYSVSEAKQRPQPEDLLRVTTSALWRSGIKEVAGGVR